jgi:membrane-associated phospholipid phosphatase
MDGYQAGTFLGQHAILALGLVLFSLYAAAIGLWHLLDRQQGKLWNFAEAAWKRLQRSAVLSAFQHRYPRGWVTVTHRLSPGGYLGLHFTVSICVLFIAAAIFFLLADEVGEQDWLVQFDHALSTSLHEHSTIATVGIFQTNSSLGDASTLTAVGLLVIVGLVVTRHWQLVFVWVIALLGVGFLNESLKNTFRRVRPQLPDPWIVEPGWSFPSGHAMGSLVVYGMLAYFLTLMVTNRTLRYCIIVITTTLVVTIGFSRIYLGVHYFSDVVAGYCAATFWLVLVTTGNDVAWRRRQPGK